MWVPVHYDLSIDTARADALFRSQSALQISERAKRGAGETGAIDAATRTPSGDLGLAWAQGRAGVRAEHPEAAG